MRIQLAINIVLGGLYLLANGYYTYLSFEKVSSQIMEAGLRVNANPVNLSQTVAVVCLVILIAIVLNTLIFFGIGKTKSIPIYGNLFISVGLGVWAFLMFLSPGHISYTEVFIFWILFGFTNMGLAYWGWKITHKESNALSNDVLDDLDL